MTGHHRAAVPTFLMGLLAMCVVVGASAHTRRGVTGNPAGVSATLFGVSCATVRTCVAVGGFVLRSDDGGRRWTKPRQPAVLSRGFIHYLNGVACPSARTCYAVASLGVVIRSTNGGRSWSRLRVAPRPGYLEAVSCPTVRVCFAVGGDYHDRPTVVATRDGGRTWSLEPLPHGLTLLYGIQCPSATVCFSTGETPDGGVVLSTTDAGAKWDSSPLPGSSSDGQGTISCISVIRCVSASTTRRSGVVDETNDGRMWHFAARLPRNVFPSDVWCIRVEQCLVVGAGSVNGKISGARRSLSIWTRRGLPRGTGTLFAVACPTSRHCVAVGSGPGRGGVVTSSDGGKQWVKRSTVFRRRPRTNDATAN